MIYRNARIEDAPRLWEMMLQLDRETKYMLYEVGERERFKSLAILEKAIAESIKNSDLLLVAFDKENPIGFVGANRETPKKISHCANVATGILESHRNQGIGTELFWHLQDWALMQGVSRLELTVICENHAAVHLYEKSGFVIEGRKKHSIFMEGRYFDEYCMAKLIEG